MLGEKAWLASQADPDKALNAVFLTLTSRKASAAELALLRSMFDEQLAHFKANEADAKAFLSVGESKRDESIPPANAAAIGIVAKALLNYDECVMKR